MQHFIEDLELVDLDERTHRLIPSRFPPIDLFERVSSPEEFLVLQEIESLTNSRLRHEVGDINLVPREDSLAGPGTSFIMAVFTHVNVDAGSRFNKGFGVYYCALDLKTSLEETKYHRAKFFRDFKSGPTKIEMRELRADLKQSLHTIIDKKDELPEIYDLENYDAGQHLGRRLKDAKSWGLQYNSVRSDGVCYAVFRPPALSNCLQSKHFEYHFNGHKISEVFLKTKVK